MRQLVVRTRKNNRTIVRHSTVVLAQGAYSLAGNRTALGATRLTAAGRRRLAHASRHRRTTTLVLTVRGGATTRQSVLMTKASRRGR